MELVVDTSGRIVAVYDELIELTALGRPAITRASSVEPDDRGLWHADLSPVGGPVLGPFPRRSAALAAELAWLRDHWLTRTR
jgi:hypothetical protein